MARGQDAARHRGAAATLSPAPAITVRVNDLTQAEATLQAAIAQGLQVTLATVAHGEALMGVGYWRAVEECLGCAVVVDCGDRSGRVMEGLRAGLTRLVFAGSAEILGRLRDQAAQKGAEIASRLTPPVLTLAPGEAPEAALRAQAAAPRLGGSPVGM